MKLLQVCAYYPPRIGGVGEMVRQLHRNYLACGIHSWVLTSKVGAHDPQIIELGSTPLSFVLGIMSMTRRTAGFDVVHCHAGETVLLPLLMKILGIKTPIIATLHIHPPTYRKACRPYRIGNIQIKMAFIPNLKLHLMTAMQSMGQRLMRWLADETVYVCHATARQSLGYGLQKNSVVHNGTTLPVPKDTLSSPSDILFVGSDNFCKRPAVCLYVLAKILMSRPETTLRFVGVSQHPELKRLITLWQLEDRVSFEGNIAPEDVHGLYQSTKILLMPSSYEGHPMALLEAGLHGVTTVASEVGGIPEILEDGLTGFVVPPNDIEKMTACCVRLLEDPALRHTMGKAARTRIEENFLITHTAAAYKDIYGQLSGRVLAEKEDCDH
ncbi:MAG: glycosyltransferase family 4 protein [Acidobacteria bacterium]|nr:glycosyltransferase family 4 protein [Acidobacteriota bacterium]